MSCPKCGGMIQSQFEWEYHREYGRYRYSCLTCGLDTYDELEAPVKGPRTGRGRIVKLPGRPQRKNGLLRLPGDGHKMGGGPRKRNELV